MGNTDIDTSPEYKAFRSSVSLRKIPVESGAEWSYYDAGPRSIRNPIIFLPPVCGTADIYFRQLLSLSAAGCRAISVNHPVVWSVGEWCISFNDLLNTLEIDRVHIFGASLGGFLAQKFAEFSGHGRRVQSLILCNAFNDTDIFQQTTSSSSFWALPALVLKTMVMGNLDLSIGDLEMRQAVKFMSDKLDAITQQELASRLTLNCVSCYVKPQEVQVLSSNVTLMNVLDHHALSSAVHNEMQKMYPEARRALLKTGGNFPYLSRSDEVNVFIQIHLQQFADSVYSAMEPKLYPEETAPSLPTSNIQDHSSDSEPNDEPNDA